MRRLAILVFVVIVEILALAYAAFAQNTVRADVVTITSGPCELSAGSGSPEGVVAGKPCDTYWRTDASLVNPPTYLKWSGNGTTTGWIALPGLTRANTWTENQTILKDLAVAGNTQLGQMVGGYALVIDTPPSWNGTWTGATWSNRRPGATDLRSDWYVDVGQAMITSYNAGGGGSYRPLWLNAAPVAVLQGGLHVGGTTDPGVGNVWVAGNVQSPGYISQSTGWRNTAAGAGDYRYLFTDEMHAKSFVADMEQALAGGQVIGKSVAVLASSFTAPAAGNTATLTVKDLQGAAGLDVFQTGDTVLLRSFSRSGDGPPALTIGNCWGTVGVATHNGDGTQSFTFTRSATYPGGMAGGTVVPATALALDYGVAGAGIYEVNAIDGANGANSPYAQVVTWSATPVGNPANPTLTTRMRIGNLTGITGVAGEYGLYAGVGYAASNGQYIKAGTAGVVLHGVDLKMWEGANNVLTIARNSGSPYLSLGATAPSTFATGAGVWMGKDGANGYKFRVGDPSAAWLSYSPTTGEGLRIMHGAAVRASFKPDGSGSLASGGITWDTLGNAVIAGWNFNASAMWSTTAGMSLGDYPFYSGAAYANRATAPFRVDTSGNLYATSATLTGNLTFGTTGFVASAGNSWGAGNGIWMGYNVNNYKFRVGNSGGQRLEYDGGNLQLYGSTYSLTSGGGLQFGRSGSEGGDSNTIRWSDGNIIGGSNSYTWLGGPGNCCGGAMNIKLSGSQIDLNAGNVNLLRAYDGRVSIYQPIGYNPAWTTGTEDVIVLEASTLKYRSLDSLLAAHGFTVYANCEGYRGGVVGFDIWQGLVWKVNCANGDSYQR